MPLILRGPGIPRGHMVESLVHSFDLFPTLCELAGETSDSAEALEGDRERLISLGFDAYLSKPLQAAALQDTLTSVWTKQRLVEIKPDLDLVPKN